MKWMWGMLLALTAAAAGAQPRFGSEDVYPPWDAVEQRRPEPVRETLPRPASAASAAAAQEGQGSLAKPARRSSLFAEGRFQALTADRRSFKVGDLVTVMIYENASASSSADTGASRDAGVGVTLNRPSRPSSSLSGSTTNDFTGAGRTQRTGRILAQLTVAVKEVLSNQDLVLVGEQQLDINGERQLIRLEGRVRPRDVNELNTVPSSRVAEAKITFLGDGVVGERQRPGWWQQLVTLFGL